MMNERYNYNSVSGRLTQSAAIAAIYVALTMIVAPIAFGPIQFRISEALCVLPYFLPGAVPGITIGCFLANLLCGAASQPSSGHWVPTILERKANGWYVFRRSFPTPSSFRGSCVMPMAPQI